MAAQQEIEERKKLEEVQAATAQEVMALYAALSKIAGTPENVKSLAWQIADVIVNGFQAYECGVWLLTEDQSQIICKAYGGPEAIEAEDYSLPMTSAGLITTATKTSEIIYVTDVRQDPRYIAGSGISEPTLSEFVVPLQVHGEILGVINAESPRLDGLCERTWRLIAAFAENAALAIQNARLVASLGKCPIRS